MLGEADKHAVQYLFNSIAIEGGGDNEQRIPILPVLPRERVGFKRLRRGLVGGLLLYLS